ncbi:hypothetical protein C8A03DRAFT_19844 [Achaetomium macrosporum]|uniref:Uncharacterized protein n=1 Tax=Achaetomium macrosporum TaxID=79813 RepID=A0AAN7H9K3_9PEZI|nr:hypothetical protein C8A03DRAFT_19844 [Achaetomium macrosporum]
MHFSALMPLALLALGAQGTLAGVIPNGYSAFYSIFDHVGCNMASHGMTTVSDTSLGQCLNFTYPAISVNVDSLKDGCSVTVFPYADCAGRPDVVNNAGCFNSDAILMSATVNCESE